MSDAAYGLRPLVFLNTAVFVLFAFSFLRPRSQRDCQGDCVFPAGRP